MSGLEAFLLTRLSGKQSGLADGAEHEKSGRCGSYLSRCCQMRKAKQNRTDVRCGGCWIQENSAGQHVRTRRSERSAAALTI